MAKQAHLQAILSAVDRLSPTLAKIGVNTARTKALMTTLNSVNFNKLRGTFKVINKSVTDVGSAASDVAGKLLPLVGLGALSFAGLGVGFFAASRGAMQFSAGLQDTSELTGESVTQLQLLQGAFRMGGVEAEAATDAIVKFNKGMADAAAGKDKSFAALMTRLRIPLRDAKGQIRGMTDVLPELSDAFAKNTNPAVRTRIAMELFGKSGTKLIGTLAQGGKSLKELFAELESSGRILGAGAIGRLDKLDENLEELGVRYKVLSAEILSRAAPAVQLLVERMQSWISSNREVIAQRVGAVIERVANAFTAWIESGGFERLTTEIRHAWTVLGEFVDRLGGLVGVAKLVGVLILAGPVASLVMLGGALVRLSMVLLPLAARGLMLMLGPLGLVARGFMVCLPALLAFGKGLLLTFGMPLLLAFKGLVALAGLLAGALLTGLQVAARAVLFLGRALLLNPIGLAVTAIAGAAYLIWSNWETLGPKFSGLWEGIKGAMSAAWASIIGVLEGAWSRIKPIIDPIINGISKAASIASNLLPNFAAPLPAGGAGSGTGGVPAIARRPTPLMQAGAMQTSARVQGEMKVRFENAPPGMRVDPGKTNSSGLDFNPDVGYRAMGGLG